MEEVLAIIQGIPAWLWVVYIVAIFVIGSLLHWAYSEYEYRKLVGKRKK